MIKHPNTEPQIRKNELATYHIMDTAAEPEFDELTRYASAVCETPIACISLLDDRRQWFKSRVGLDLTETSLEIAFCAHSIANDGVMVVKDATRDPRFCKNELVTVDEGVRFYAGAPLISEDGIPLGTICVVDRKARSLSKSQESVLLFLAKQTMKLLERRRAPRPRKEINVDKRRSTLRQRSLRILDAVSEIASSTSDINSMLSQALYAICEETQWSIGHAWLPNPQLAGKKGPMHVWRADRERELTSYRNVIMENESECWSGLLGHVMKTRAATALPAWQWEASQPQFRSLRDQAVIWGVALPLAGKEMWGAIEFYSTENAAPDAEFCEVLTQVGRYLGRGFERQRAVTTLKLSEAYFRHLTEESLDLVTVLDRQAKIRFESRSLAVELGWDPNEILGRSAFEFVHPDDCANVLAAFTESLRTDGPTSLLSFRFKHKDGSYRTLEGRGNNLLSNPAVAGVVFSSRDISEKKRLEDQFGQLAGGIAHDFNNLLTVIVGYSSVAEAHAEADEKLKHAVTEIRRASDRAAGLTGQLLALTGRQVLQPRVFHLNSVVQESGRGLGIVLGETIDLALHLNAGDAWVRADVGQFDLVLRHLAMNAYDAMPAGGEVHLSTSILKVSGRADAAQHGLAPGDYAVLNFKDAGCGMTPDVCVRALEPYFTTKARAKGTGLGLATCQGIIRQSGGRMTLQSEPALGTTVTLYLPLAEPQAPVFQKPEAATSKSCHVPTILFAEDEEILRELGASVLEELGYRVLSAENGRAALELLKASPEVTIDLLLTDIIMPEMDGKALAESIRERSPATPILFCSGYAQDSSFYNGLPEGTAFISKPYSVSALADNVSKMIQLGVAA